MLFATLLLTLPVPASPAIVPAEDPACAYRGTPAALARRASPLDSLTFQVGTASIKICYGRPAVRGRTMLGGVIPFDELWRTGANEPTTIHTSAPIAVAGIRLEAGTYALYTIPGKTEWTVILNRSTSQWGHESEYTAEVQAQDVGRAAVPATVTSSFTEVFTIEGHAGDRGAGSIVLRLERTRVVIPVQAP